MSLKYAKKYLVAGSHEPVTPVLGFRIQGLGFRVWGLGFRV